jgi:hypothetical protein
MPKFNLMAVTPNLTNELDNFKTLFVNLYMNKSNSDR